MIAQKSCTLAPLNLAFPVDINSMELPLLIEIPMYPAPTPPAPTGLIVSLNTTCLADLTFNSYFLVFCKRNVCGIDWGPSTTAFPPVSLDKLCKKARSSVVSKIELQTPTFSGLPFLPALVMTAAIAAAIESPAVSVAVSARIWVVTMVKTPNEGSVNALVCMPTSTSTNERS